MDDKKRTAIALGEAAGERYARELYERDGIAAMRAAHDWMAICVGEKLYADPAVCPLQYKAFVQVFARGAQRFADILVRGFEHESLPYPEGIELARAVSQLLERKPEIFAQIERATKVTNPSATLEDVYRAAITYFDKRSLGDRPELIAAYETGAALARKGA